MQLTQLIIWASYNLCWRSKGEWPGLPWHLVAQGFIIANSVKITLHLRFVYIMTCRSQLGFSFRGHYWKVPGTAFLKCRNLALPIPIFLWRPCTQPSQTDLYRRCLPLEEINKRYTGLTPVIYSTQAKDCRKQSLAMTAWRRGGQKVQCERRATFIWL